MEEGGRQRKWRESRGEREEGRTERRGAGERVTSKVEPAMEQITRQLEQLQIAIAGIQANQGNVPSAANRSTYAVPPHIATGSNAIPVGGSSTSASPAAVPFPRNEPQLPCMVCKGPPPYHWKMACPELRKLLDEGLARVDPMTRRVLFPDGTEVPMHPAGMMVVIRERAGRTTSAAHPVSLRWNAPSVSDGPRGFVATTTADFEGFPVEKRGREQDDIGGRTTEKRKIGVPYVDVPTRQPGNPSATTGEPSDSDAVPGRPKVDLPKRKVRFMNEDEEGMEGEASTHSEEEERQKRVPASRKWSGVKTSYNDEAANIPSAILDSRLSLSIGSVLALSDDLSRTMSEKFRIRRVPVPTTTWKAKGTSAMVEEEEGEEKDVRKEFRAASIARQPLFAGVVGRLELTVAGIKVSALFDTGSEVNLMPHRVYTRTNVPLTKSNHYLTDANAGSTLLLGFAENVEVICGAIELNQHIHVQKDATYEFLVGMPFMRATQARTWWDEHGSYWVKMTGSGNRRHRLSHASRRSKEYHSHGRRSPNRGPF